MEATFSSSFREVQVEKILLFCIIRIVRGLTIVPYYQLAVTKINHLF